MRRILFIDDEQRVLDGLRDLLRRKRREWSMTFALGGEEGLRILDAEPQDVVVTDLQMPRIDGIEVLARVKRDHPETARLVLSGQVKIDSARRLVPLAQQFLSKPCDARALADAVERTCRLRDVLTDQALQRTVGSLGTLPALPRAHARLGEVLRDDKSSACDVAAVIEQDLGLSAKVLQLVNSAFFAIRRRITSVQQAVALLGMSTIESLVLSTRVFDLGGKNACLSLERVQRRSMLVGRLAQQMLEDSQDRGDALTAGLLHDVGLFIMAAKAPDGLRSAVDSAAASSLPLHEAERSANGAAHPELGAYLLGLWGLPHPIVEAVAWHHDPSKAGTARFDVTTAVHVADELIHERGFPVADDAPSAGLDMEHLERLGVVESLEQWRDLAARATAAVDEEAA